jgi:hypothetical protein
LSYSNIRLIVMERFVRECREKFTWDFISLRCAVPGSIRDRILDTASMHPTDTDKG